MKRILFLILTLITFLSSAQSSDSVSTTSIAIKPLNKNVSFGMGLRVKPPFEEKDNMRLEFITPKNDYIQELFSDKGVVQVNDEYNPLHTDINYMILGGMGALFLASGITVHLYQKNAWWKDERTAFHFQDDWDYALWQDKWGHFYGTLILTHLLTSGLEASDVQSEEAILIGASAAFAMQMYVEIEDGFGPNWGFSPGDAYTDLLGALVPVGQYYYPFLNNFRFQYSYFPTSLMKGYKHSGHDKIIFDDYEGQKYWLSVKVNNLLPEAAAEYWPDWLMIAGGVGVRNLDGGGGGYRDFYIALDYDTETLPLYGRFGEWVKNTLNYFRLPLPGIRVNNKTVFFMFCY